MKSRSQTGDNAADAALQGQPPRLRYVDVVELSHRRVSEPRRATAQAPQAPHTERRPAALRIDPPARPVSGETSVEAARAAIAEANRQASRIGLGPRFLETLEETRLATPALLSDDARWVFAVRVRREIQGGRAAIVAPESRKRLLKLAHRLGLRDFDANLVIAIVQDDARLYPSPAPVPSSAAKGPLAMVRPAQPDEGSRALVVWWSVGASVSLAGLACYFLIRWLIGV